MVASHHLMIRIVFPILKIYTKAWVRSIDLNEELMAFQVIKYPTLVFIFLSPGRRTLKQYWQSLSYWSTGLLGYCCICKRLCGVCLTDILCDGCLIYNVDSSVYKKEAVWKFYHFSTQQPSLLLCLKDLCLTCEWYRFLWKRQFVMQFIQL